MSNIFSVIKSIQDIMRKDVGVDGDAQRISQLVWMFFLKIYDDREAEIELLEDAYKSPLPEKLRWRNWAADSEGMTGNDLGQFVNDELFPTLKEKLVLEGPNGKRAQVIRNVFEDAYNYMKSGTLIRQVINKISEINFNNTEDRHTFGSIYDQILKDLQSAGNAGEFYTPRALAFSPPLHHVSTDLGDTVSRIARSKRPANAGTFDPFSDGGKTGLSDSRISHCGVSGSTIACTPSRADFSPVFLSSLRIAARPRKPQ